MDAFLNLYQRWAPSPIVLGGKTTSYPIKKTIDRGPITPFITIVGAHLSGDNWMYPYTNLPGKSLQRPYIVGIYGLESPRIPIEHNRYHGYPARGTPYCPFNLVLVVGCGVLRFFFRPPCQISVPMSMRRT